MSLTVRSSSRYPRHILITSENFFFVGADDVIAFKPNSTMITIKNVTSYGTTGLSFGSIGQYPGVVSSPKVVLKGSADHVDRHHPGHLDRGRQVLQLGSGPGISRDPDEILGRVSIIST